MSPFIDKNKRINWGTVTSAALRDYEKWDRAEVGKILFDEIDEWEDITGREKFGMLNFDEFESERLWR